MSRQRQALGVISNQYTNNQHLVNSKSQQSLKPQPSLTNLKLHNNNENACFVRKNSSAEFEFEIFQDENKSSVVIDKENIGAVVANKAEKLGMFYNENENSNDEEEEVSEPNLMMESSGENSPMALDDTIKFGSDVESDEAAKQSKLVEERENLLINCLEYKDDILAYMRQEEKVNRPKANYMKKQQDITTSMRAILVDWLVEVSEEYRLDTETLYLAANYTDRFLSHMSVLRGKLQLVGTASMYIAAKYEEISPPDVTEFVYITDDTYTKKQVLRMEHLLLKVLDFRMNTPTTNNFLKHYLRFLKINNLVTSAKVDHLAHYLAELTLIDSDTFLHFLPSQIAASAIYLSLLTFGQKWTKQIADELAYDFDVSELKECIAALHKAMVNAPGLPQQAIQEKYKSDRFSGVSLLEAPECPFTCQ